MDRRKAIQQTVLLMGGAISASVLAGVMTGCQPSYAPDWEPKFLTKKQANIIGEIAETILPETDTLGAKSLHVDEYIDIVLKDCFSGYDQLQFNKGLEKFLQECTFFTGKAFLDCNPAEKQKFLVLNEKKGIEARNKTGEKAFITTVKELVLTGYFTSEYAITELMDYRPIPQQFESCIGTPQKIQIGIEGRSA